MSETAVYFNAAGHPLDADDGRVIAAGEFVEDLDTRGPKVKAAIENGQLIAAGQEATQRDVTYAENRTPVEYEEMTVDGLVAEASDRGLATTGKKADLVKRLKAHDDEEGNQ